MSSPVVGGLLAFLGGCVISVLNYRINLRALKKKPELLASMSVVRQILSVCYLVAVFLLAKVLPWDHIPLLIGAALGLTIPAFLLSMKLARINDSLSADADKSSGKGENPNG